MTAECCGEVKAGDEVSCEHALLLANHEPSSGCPEVHPPRLGTGVWIHKCRKSFIGPFEDRHAEGLTG
jgi:hypothetical protein